MPEVENGYEKVTVTCFSAENVSYSTRGGGILRNIFELMTSHMKYRFPQVPFCPFLLKNSKSLDKIFIIPINNHVIEIESKNVIA